MFNCGLSSWFCIQDNVNIYTLGIFKNRLGYRFHVIERIPESLKNYLISDHHE